MFKHAIVRTPCAQMIHGQTSSSMGLPDIELALIQHKAYIEALQYCGLQVHVLDPDSRYPDSTFVEDVALCTPECAVITNPGAPSRNGEEVEMGKVLQSFYTCIESIHFPGTLDGGDVMMTGRHFYIGISSRTNLEGANQLIRILQKYGMTGTKVPLYDMLHLKSGIAYLEQNNLLVGSELVHHPAFTGFHKMIVDPEEAYAANSVWINGTVLVPAQFKRTRTVIEQHGYQTISLNVSEFRKLDGGLSCLSLRF